MADISPLKENVAPTTFTCFLDLPYELRSAIWRLCLPPRTVVIYYCADRSNRTTTQPSPLTLACRESRQEYDSVYEYCFNETDNGKQQQTHKGVPIDFSRDSIYCPYMFFSYLSTCAPSRPLSDFYRIQHLHLQINQRFEAISDTVRKIRPFKNLKTLVLCILPPTSILAVPLSPSSSTPPPPPLSLSTTTTTTTTTKPPKHIVSNILPISAIIHRCRIQVQEEANQLNLVHQLERMRVLHYWESWLKSIEEEKARDDLSDDDWTLTASMLFVKSGLHFGNYELPVDMTGGPQGRWWGVRFGGMD